MAEITRILEAVQQGDSRAAAELFPEIYEELRKVAGQKMAREGLNSTLQPTELVNEAWLRLAGSQGRDWKNRAHFFGAAAEAMRRILVDRARRRNRLKRGGQWERVDVEEADLPSPMPDDDLLALDEALAVPQQKTDLDLLGLNDALEQLAQMDPRQNRIVELRFFAGLSIEETAEVMQLSPATIKREWNSARAWLFRELSRGPANV